MKVACQTMLTVLY